MKKTARVISMTALIATVLPSLLYFTDVLSLQETKTGMIFATAVWFLSAPLWMQIRPAGSAPHSGASAKK